MLSRRAFHLTCGGLVAAGIGRMQTLSASEEGGGQGWPNWRGPSRDGYVSEKTPWPASLTDQHLSLIWERGLDVGYSGPVLSERAVYVTETRDQKTEHVLALDRLNGQLLWEEQWLGAMKVPFFARANGDWIRSTPAVAGDSLVVGGMRDVVVCLNSSNGETRWRIDFPDQLGTPLPDFGLVCSPLIDNDRVYLQAAAGVVCLNLADGRILWRGLVDGGAMMGSAFSSPMIAELDGERQLIVQTRSQLVGVSLEDGSQLWQIDIEAFRGMNILTPTVYNGKLFTSSYGGRSWLYAVERDASGSWQTRMLWENKAQGYMSSPIVIGDHLYLHLRNQRLVCIDLKTGDETFTSRPFGKYWSMVTNGQQLLVLDERGELLLLDATPAEFTLLDRRQVCDEESWAHLALAGEQLFVRHLKGLKVFRWA